MATTIAKTVVATGCSSGLGLEVIKQLLAKPEPYNFILGVRDTKKTAAALQGAKRDGSDDSLAFLPLDLEDLRNVQTFARQTLEKLGPNKLDYLFLNAGSADDTTRAAPRGSKWSAVLMVNHWSHHYLVHLLREKLVASKSRLVFVSSGAIRQVDNTSKLVDGLKAGSGLSISQAYSYSKFVALLGAHWWRHQLAGQCQVLAVSPGMVAGTDLGRHSDWKITLDMKDAIELPTGASNLIRAINIQDFPADPDQIFLTSWGEWWSKDVFQKSLDKGLQDRWCPGKEKLEREGNLVG